MLYNIGYICLKQNVYSIPFCIYANVQQYISVYSRPLQLLRCISSHWYYDLHQIAHIYNQ